MRKCLFSELVYVLCPGLSDGDATFRILLFIGKMFWFKIDFPLRALCSVLETVLSVFLCCKEGAGCCSQAVLTKANVKSADILLIATSTKPYFGPLILYIKKVIYLSCSPSFFLWYRCTHLDPLLPQSWFYRGIDLTYEISPYRKPVIIEKQSRTYQYFVLCIYHLNYFVHKMYLYYDTHRGCWVPIFFQIFLYVWP